MGKPSRKRRNPLYQSSVASQPENRRTIPQSPAWFAELSRVNARQAGMTKSLVRSAGRLDVCTVCGDTPALIYDSVEDPHLPLRLCDTCLVVQRDVFGTVLQLRAVSPSPEH